VVAERGRNAPVESAELRFPASDQLAAVCYF
jgi:hypothetical protein